MSKSRQNHQESRGEIITISDEIIRLSLIAGLGVSDRMDGPFQATRTAFEVDGINWKMSEEELKTGAQPEPANVIEAARGQLGIELREVRQTVRSLEIRKN